MDVDPEEVLARAMRRAETAELFFRAALQGLQMTATSRTGTVYTVQFSGDATVYRVPFVDDAVNATYHMYRATTHYKSREGTEGEIVGFAGIDPLTGTMLFFYTDRVRHKRTSTVISITIP